MKTWLVHAALVLGAGACSGACGGKSDPSADAVAAGDARVIDRSDDAEIVEVAYGSLLAYRDKNMERLADLGPPGAREKLIFIEPRNPHYEELLGDSTWRMKSLRAWDGKKESVKVRRGIDTAFGYYGEDADNYYVVEVRKEPFKECRDGKKACKDDADCGAGNACESKERWSFHDLRQMPKASSPGAPSPENTLKIGTPPDATP